MKNIRCYTMIQAVYIISITGIPIYFTNRVQNAEYIEEATLFSGVISAIQTALVEIDVGVPSYFRTRKNDVYLEATDNFAVALVTDQDKSLSKEDSRDILLEIINELIFHFPSLEDPEMLNNDEKDKIDDIVSKMLQKWEKKIKDSEATKKLKDSIW